MTKQLRPIISPALLVALLVSLLSACTLGQALPTEPSAHSSLTPFSPSWETFTPTPSTTPTITDTVTPAPTLTQVPTATWAFNPAGSASVPILLYHHISDEAPGTRYYTTIAEFQKEMDDLKSWGYTTIPISLLVDALRDGAPLPPRPIVITFDDGHQSVYDNAFPIMKKLGMVGVVYIVANRLESQDFMNVAELKDLLDAGWEVGSHSMTHADLTQSHNQLRYQILESRLKLESELGAPVKTFAYPFGAMDGTVAQKTSDYGYKAAVGLGRSWIHTLDSLYYLSRIEVFGGLSPQDFAKLLTWHEPLNP